MLRGSRGEIVVEVGELGVEETAQNDHGADDDGSDESKEQPILDCCCPGLVSRESAVDKGK